MAVPARQDDVWQSFQDQLYRTHMLSTQILAIPIPAATTMQINDNQNIATIVCVFILSSYKESGHLGNPIGSGMVPSTMFISSSDWSALRGAWPPCVFLGSFGCMVCAARPLVTRTSRCLR